MFCVPCSSFHNLFVLSCYVSLCSEFRVAYFFSFFCAVLLCVFMFWVPCCLFLLFFPVVLLCIFMFWVPCCSFHNFCLCCPVMYLYVLSSVLLISFVFVCCPVMYLYVMSSVLLISLVFFLLSCYVSLCSEFRVAHFIIIFFVLSCYVSLCSEFRVAHFIICFCVVLLCVFMFWVPCYSFL